ncbi:hypothetical protein ACERZ8_19805 [Tateyamaria armeniaca]|uniref:Uncharacterized protein n=1 Tax=Tateyamaria armeniaca TaxID=2518930 RepID=A0ABW8UXW8_9RHOB
MHKYFLIFTLLLALPAAAQQERECRGKQAFDLGDGSYGCLQEVGTSQITTTRTRDDGASSSVRKNATGKIEVLMFGEYNGSRQVTGNRIKTICRTFLPTLQAELTDLSYHRIVVVLIWPRIENPGNYVPKAEAKVAVQPGFSSAQCRGVKFFG